MGLQDKDEVTSGQVGWKWWHDSFLLGFVLIEGKMMIAKGRVEFYNIRWQEVPFTDYSERLAARLHLATVSGRRMDTTIQVDGTQDQSNSWNGAFWTTLHGQVLYVVDSIVGEKKV